MHIVTHDCEFEGHLWFCWRLDPLGTYSHMTSCIECVHWGVCPHACAWAHGDRIWWPHVMPNLDGEQCHVTPSDKSFQFTKIHINHDRPQPIHPSTAPQ